MQSAESPFHWGFFFVLFCCFWGVLLFWSFFAVEIVLQLYKKKITKRIVFEELGRKEASKCVMSSS